MSAPGGQNTNDFIPFGGNSGKRFGGGQGGSYTPYNRNQHFNKYKNFHGHRSTGKGEVDISAYYHPSMMQDPWRDLYKHFNRSNSNGEQTKNNTNDDQSHNPSSQDIEKKSTTKSLDSE